MGTVLYRFNAIVVFNCNSLKTELQSFCFQFIWKLKKNNDDTPPYATDMAFKKYILSPKTPQKLKLFYKQSQLDGTRNSNSEESSHGKAENVDDNILCSMLDLLENFQSCLQNWSARTANPERRSSRIRVTKTACDLK